MLGRFLDTELKLLLSEGTVARFTMREAYSVLSTWQMWVLLAISLYFFSSSGPAILVSLDSIWGRIGVWIISVSLYLGLMVPWAFCFQYVWNRFTRMPIPLFLVAGPLIQIATVLGVISWTYFAEPGKPLLYGWTLKLAIHSFIVTHLLEMVAISRLIPLVRARNAPRRTVMLAGKRFDLEAIVRVRAAEHQLELHRADGVEVVRERLSNFLEQVADEDGVQTHRSHWVARPYVGALDDQELALDCGVRVPVARGRIKDVEAWTEEFGA